jgi:hypothetical protein
MPPLIQSWLGALAGGREFQPGTPPYSTGMSGRETAAASVVASDRLGGRRSRFFATICSRSIDTNGPLARSAHRSARGGRSWWAHFEFTRINIKPIILYKKIEESLRIEPKTSRVGKCSGYLDLRAFQGGDV